MLPNSPIEQISRELSDLKKRMEVLEHQRSGTNRLIDSSILTIAVASVTFSNIADIYDYLLILYYVRTDFVGTPDELSARFNGDAGFNYDFFSARFSSAGPVLTERIATNRIRIGDIAGAGSPANTFDTGDVIIGHYANNINHKSLIASSSLKTSVGAGGLSRAIISGWWKNIVPITSITLFPFSGNNLLAGSRFDLYGIQGG